MIDAKVCLPPRAKPSNAKPRGNVNVVLHSADPDPMGLAVLFFVEISIMSFEQPLFTTSRLLFDRSQYSMSQSTSRHRTDLRAGVMGMRQHPRGRSCYLPG